MRSKKELEIQLSKIPKFENPKAELEQHLTPADLASTILWAAYLSGEIEGKVVADLGCGTGIFCKGAEVLGAEECLCIEIDLEALNIAKSNLNSGIVNADVLSCPLRSVDTVLMNPPFGTVQRGIDKKFLMVAFSIAKEVIYSIHLFSEKTEKLFRRLALNYGFQTETIITNYKMPIEYPWHRKRFYEMPVQVYKFKKIKQEMTGT